MSGIENFLFYFFGYNKWHEHVNAVGILCILAIMFPASGWLADVYFGRYRVIKVSMIILWIAAILYSISLWWVANTIFKILVYLFVYIGFSGFQANVVQFCIDQLLDSSSADIVSLARTYAWIFFAGDCLTKITLNCACHL